jgi:hypothetical protein
MEAKHPAASAHYDGAPGAETLTSVSRPSGCAASAPGGRFAVGGDSTPMRYPLQAEMRGTRGIGSAALAGGLDAALGPGVRRL